MTRRYVTRAALPPPILLPSWGSHFCRACGRPVPLPRKGAAGRPKDYCDAICKDFMAARSTFAKYATTMEQRMDARRWLEFRGDLWLAGNRRAWNRGLKLPLTTNQKQE